MIKRIIQAFKCIFGIHTYIKHSRLILHDYRFYNVITLKCIYCGHTKTYTELAE